MFELHLGCRVAVRDGIAALVLMREFGTTRRLATEKPLARSTSAVPNVKASKRHAKDRAMVPLQVVKQKIIEDVALRSQERSGFAQCDFYILSILLWNQY